MSAVENFRSRIFCFVLFPHREEHREALKKFESTEDFSVFTALHEEEYNAFMEGCENEADTSIETHFHIVVCSPLSIYLYSLCDLFGITPDDLDMHPLDKTHIGKRLGDFFVTYFSKMDESYILLSEQNTEVMYHG